MPDKKKPIADKLKKAKAIKSGARPGDTKKGFDDREQSTGLGR